MSIDAKIREVESTTKGYLLYLEPRYTGHGWSICEQPTLLIVEPTWEPLWGMAIWGNADRIFIETGVIACRAGGICARPYRREGYIHLREHWWTFEPSPPFHAE